MRKRAWLVLLAMVLVVSLVAFAACGGEEEAPPEEEVWEWPDRLLTVTMSTRSPVYGALVGWTTPMQEDPGVQFRIITERDSRLKEQWVREGRFFTKSPHQSRDMFYGERGYTRRDWGPYMSSIWMPAGKSSWGPVTLANSGIKTVYDIKPGSKCNLVTLGAAPQQSVVAVAMWANVNPEDIIWVPLNQTVNNGRFLMDGKCDWTFTYHTTPSWYEVEASPGGLHWIPLDYENDPEGMARFLKVYPWTNFGYATGGLPTAEGVPMALNVSPYVTRFDTDPELIYRMVKWLDENYDRYKDSNPWCAAMTMETLLDVAEENYEPLHDGTVRYLEEKGLWTEELEDRRQFNIEQMTLWVDAFQTAVDMADERDMDVDPDNEEWQEFWENYRDSRPDLKLLVSFQERGQEQRTYHDFFDYWHSIQPEY